MLKLIERTAERAARERGHRIQAWRRLGADRAESTCAGCQGVVTVSVRPDEAQIAGLTGIQCRAKEGGHAGDV